MFTGKAAGVDDRRFFTTMALAALAIVFLGFAATYYLWPITRATHTLAGRPIAPSFPLIVHLHAAGFSAWILLLLVQVRLVAAGRKAVHKRMGIVAAGLVPFLVVTGLMTAVHGARGGWTPPGGPFADALNFMIVPVGDMVVFTALVIPGLALRRRSGVHKRLMLFATIGALVPPAATRLPIVAGWPIGLLLFVALVLAPAVRDFRCHAQYRWVSLLVGLGILASIPVRALVGISDPWRAFAARLVG
jgi:hypothetical protein